MLLSYKHREFGTTLVMVTSIVLYRTKLMENWWNFLGSTIPATSEAGRYQKKDVMQGKRHLWPCLKTYLTIG